MNTVFLLIVLVAFVTAAWHQVTREPGDPDDPEATTPMAELSEASGELLRDVEALGTAVMDAKRVVEENRDGAERNAVRSGEMNELARELTGIVEALESIIGLAGRAGKAGKAGEKPA